MAYVPMGAGTRDEGKVTCTDKHLAIQPQHERQWRDLWQQYLNFYDAGVPDLVTDLTWQKMLDGGSVIGLAAVCPPNLVGFAIAVLHEATWSIGRAAYLEDLFVCDNERGRGVGRKLIDEVILCARAEGCAVVYWHTRASNDAARRLYDSYADADDFVRYRLTL
jgi:GNAT superfamily N-acetyltransferase